MTPARIFQIALLVKLDRLTERLDHVPEAAPLAKLVEQNKWLLSTITDLTGETK